MTTTLAEALTALENATSRIEQLESRIAQRSADAQRLRHEVESAIRDLDQMISTAPDAGPVPHD